MFRSHYTLAFFVLSLITALLYSPFETGKFADNNSHKRILIVTAHPDDECMFFAPTILGLQHTPQKDVEIYSLCLSVGDADGLGSVRREEFHRSYEVLGVPEDRRWIVDHPDLQDNITVTWEANVVSNVVTQYIIDNKIDTVLTFDYGGISKHPNHVSLPHGLVHTLKTFHASHQPSPRLYTLITVSTFSKYTSILAPLFAKFDLVTARVLGYQINFVGQETALSTGLPLSRHDVELNARGMPVFVSGIHEYRNALKAMRMHASQLVWFRWLYVSFSRYMWVNEWLEVKVQV